MVWEIICWIILLFFTLLGLAVLIYSLLFRVIARSGKQEYLLLIPSSAADDDAVSQIYAAQLRAELLGRRQCSGVLVVCSGLDEETAAQCASACNACGCTHICTMEELQQLFSCPVVGKEETHGF